MSNISIGYDWSCLYDNKFIPKYMNVFTYSHIKTYTDKYKN